MTSATMQRARQQRFGQRRLPRCPRCAGNLFFDDEAGTRMLACLQCGRTYAVRTAPTAVDPTQTKHAA